MHKQKVDQTDTGANEFLEPLNELDDCQLLFVGGGIGDFIPY